MFSSFPLQAHSGLLIAWNNKPDSFRNQQELIAYLTKQKKDWLVELLLEFAEKDSEILERIFKIKDGKARRTRKGWRRTLCPFRTFR